MPHLEFDGFPMLDRLYLEKLARHMSNKTIERIAVELGIEADSETVSFVRQACQQVANEMRLEQAERVNERNTAKVRTR